MVDRFQTQNPIKQHRDFKEILKKHRGAFHILECKILYFKYVSSQITSCIYSSANKNSNMIWGNFDKLEKMILSFIWKNKQVRIFSKVKKKKR